MKILHYINNLSSGGAEKLLTDILPLMQKEGNEVSVLICNSKNNLSEYEKLFKENGIKLIDLKSSLYNPLQVFKLSNLISRNRYDIVHGHLFPSQYWLSLSSMFVQEHSVFIKTEHSNSNRRQKYYGLKFLESFIYKKYKVIIAISNSVKVNLDNWLSGNHEIEVINNGVNLEKINSESNNRSSIFSKEFINILMVGRFDGIIKDQLTLIKAMKDLPKNFKLYFAGEGPKLEDIKRKLIELKLDRNIEFLGFRNDVYLLMQSTDINILSTNYEGISGVALESLASGKPFLGSDVIGVNDVVPDQSYLFPKANYKVLAQKILEISGNKMLQHEMVSKAKSHVLKYDINLMVSKYLELYNRLLKK
jgi:glycosyltransferase involved in cell wall biosynthesis